MQRFLFLNPVDIPSSITAVRVLNVLATHLPPSTVPLSSRRCVEFDRFPLGSQHFLFDGDMVPDPRMDIRRDVVSVQCGLLKHCPRPGSAVPVLYRLLDLPQDFENSFIALVDLRNYLKNPKNRMNVILLLAACLSITLSLFHSLNRSHSSTHLFTLTFPR